MRVKRGPFYRSGGGVSHVADLWKKGPVLLDHTYQLLHVSQHICFSYLFPGLSFPGDASKHCITATSNNNRLFGSPSPRDSYKIHSCSLLSFTALWQTEKKKWSMAAVHQRNFAAALSVSLAPCSLSLIYLLSEVYGQVCTTEDRRSSQIQEGAQRADEAAAPLWHAKWKILISKEPRITLSAVPLRLSGGQTRRGCRGCCSFLTYFKHLARNI